MNTLSVKAIYLLGVGAWLIGAFASLAMWRKPALARRICCGTALVGSVLGGLAAILGFEGKRNIGFFGFLFHLLLLSLTIVFTAANAFFFLIGWEVMALAAYGLVAFYHEREESRSAGLLYVIMAHIDVGCLLLGFSLLIQASGSTDFASFHTAAAQLSGGRQAIAFVLFFLGFGIKAGVIPFHIWLPAAHPVAPGPISALLSGIVLKAGIYGMVRIFMDSLGGVPSWAGLLVHRHHPDGARRRPDFPRCGTPTTCRSRPDRFDVSHHESCDLQVSFIPGRRVGTAFNRHAQHGGTGRPHPSHAGDSFLFPDWRDRHLRASPAERVCQ